MSKLSKHAFADLYNISSGLSSTKSQAGHGAPFLSFRTVFNNIFLPSELPDLMETNQAEQETYSIKKGDIFLTRTSETVDELAMSCVALKDYPNATYSGFVKRLRPKTTGIANEKFMAFYLRSRYFRKVIDCNTIMTLRASFNEDMFSFLTLYLPDFETQTKAGELLYNLERKIQLNKAVNDNLQQQIKGDKERLVYFDARTKIHLQNYLASRTDTEQALFVSLKAPHKRLQIGGVESRLREMGKRLDIPKVHPHKFRRTLATVAIDKGMPIEQLQQLLGHQRIDTTLKYAMVKQSNVKLAHKKYIG